MSPLGYASALSLNANGVLMMAQGNFSTAVASFYAALKVIKPLASPSSKCTGTASGAKAWDLACTAAISDSVESTNFRTLFCQCFMVVPVNEEVKDPTTPDIEIFCAVLVYNVGLVYHLSGLCEDERGAYHLKKAMRLYKVAASQLRGLHQSEEGLAVFLAVFNNIAALALELEEAYTFDEYVRCMGEILKEGVEFYTPILWTMF